jgi:pimeloyl-ACP methyl ester carboxylesterase
MNSFPTALFLIGLSAALLAQSNSQATAANLENARHEIPKPTKQPAIEEGYISTDDGTRLFYQKTGSGSHVVILPLRLYTFNAFEQLADQYTVIAYDTRGRGRSDPIPDDQKVAKLSIQHDVQDVERIRRHFNVQKINLIGYSYLGLMIVVYAMDHPDHVERLVQLGAVPIKFGTHYPDNLVAKDEPGDPKLLQELRRLRSEENYHITHPKEYCEKEWTYTRLGLVGNPANVDKVSAKPCEMPNEWPANLVKHFESSLASIQRLDLSKEKLASVKVPVLTIHGTKDRNAPYGGGRDWALTLPNARLLTINGGAHQSFDEFPDIVLPAVRTFLGGNWPERAQQVTSLNTGS